jgi:succinate dehydrogenase/fumarate reductase flavoprotein subunit
MVDFLKENPGHNRTCPRRGDESIARIARLDGQTGGEDVHEVRSDMQRTMQAHCGVFRFPTCSSRAWRRSARGRADGAHRDQGQVEASSTPPASRRSNWTT